MLVPELRFKGFEGEWENIQLGSICSKIGSGSTPTGGASAYDKTGVVFIRSQNVNNNKLILDDVVFISNKINEKMKGSIVKPNDVLLNITGASIGRTCKVPNDFEIGNVNQHVCILRLNLNNSPIFLQVLLSSKVGQKQIFQSQTGSGREGLNFQSIRLFKLPIPSLPEQEKIAGFLSAVDQKITQLTRKKTLLEDYKKGVMQKIFSREVRFKSDEGMDFPDWEEVRLGEVIRFVNTNSLSRNDLNYTEGATKNIHYGDIHTKFRMGFDITKENVPFINPEIDVSKITEEQYCQKGDVVIADASEDYKDIGKTIEILNVDSQKLVAGLHSFLGRGVEGKTVLGFKGYLLQSRRLRLQIQTIAQGISVLGISKKNLLELKIGLPALGEQKKIADFLSAIDEQVLSMGELVDQTKKFKSGLLQRLFV